MNFSPFTSPFIFIKRLPHSRGFGIQSPTDYAFVNDVIYERAEYYAYRHLPRNKFARVFFRISNHVQPEHYVISSGTPHELAESLRQACRLSHTGRTLFCNIVPQEYGQGDCIIITDIYKENKNLWQSVKQAGSKEHLIMYDLHYFGIALVDKQRYSELHTVNFY